MKKSELRAKLRRPLNGLSEEEMINRVSEETGLKFSCDKKDLLKEYNYYSAKYKGAIFNCHFSKYSKTNKKYISVGYTMKTQGAGAPCDSIEEALRRMNSFMDYVDYAVKEKKAKK